MNKFLLEFFKDLNNQVPPPENCHHCLWYDHENEDRITLGIVGKNGIFEYFCLEDDDFKSTPQTLVKAIVGVRGTPPGTHFTVE
jgi:hypothetical protein